MKKFMKVCGITALILIILGIILGVAAGSVRGRIAIEDAVRAITGGRVNLQLDFPKNWGLTAIEDSAGHFDINAADMFDERYEILEGDVEKYSLGNSAEKLEAEIGGSFLYVAESPDANFYLEAENARKLQGYIEGDTLHVKALRSGDLWEEGVRSEITLYIPANHTFRKADLEVGAGSIEMEALYAGEASLEAGAGNIEADFIQADKLNVSAGAGAASVYDMQVQNLTGETGVGYMYLEGQIDQSADLECSMGSMELYVRGAKQDFNYNLQCGMGSLELADESYSGLANEKQIDNRASKNMHLECAMGSITVNFDR